MTDIAQVFEQQFGHPPAVVGRAPGRVDLMGGHTDYNDGFVFPIALAQHIAIAASPREDRTLRVYSQNFDEWAEVSLDDLRRLDETRWVNYMSGVAHFLQEEGIELRGLDGAVWGDVPIGSGLSSSAAMEVASAVTFQALNGFEMEPVKMALLCQRAENDFVGMNCGIMDQFISLLGRADHALLIDCRSLDHEAVRIPAEGYKFLVCDTAVPRQLVDSEYNTRRAQCEQAVELLQQALPDIKALRDVTLEQLDDHRDLLPEVVYRRARHVVTENGRVLAAAEAMRRGDIEALGPLFSASHDSHRYDYEVTIPALDIISQTAVDVPGAHGARMTGAGFGGCSVCLCEEEAIEAYTEELTRRYLEQIGHEPKVYVCQAEDGATVERL
ncbi:MAG: galactokinase [Armatimonadota bacterium]